MSYALCSECARRGAEPIGAVHLRQYLHGAFEAEFLEQLVSHLEGSYVSGSELLDSYAESAQIFDRDPDLRRLREARLRREQK